MIWTSSTTITKICVISCPWKTMTRRWMCSAVSCLSHWQRRVDDVSVRVFFCFFFAFYLGEHTQHVWISSSPLMFMHNVLPSSVNTFSSAFFVQQILWRTLPLGAPAFKASLFLSFCLSPSIFLMLSPHMCSRRTKLLISHPHCSKSPAPADTKLFVCYPACVFHSF